MRNILNNITYDMGCTRLDPSYESFLARKELDESNPISKKKKGKIINDKVGKGLCSGYPSNYTSRFKLL